MAYILLPFMFLPLYASVEKLDRSLFEASADFCANDWTTFRRVTLPQILPDSTTLPLFIYGMLRRGIKPEINAIATLMLVFSLGVASLGLYLRRRD